MKERRMSKAWTAAAIAVLVLTAARVQADEFAVGVGVAYVKGLDNVFDRYKSNAAASGQSVDLDKPIPIGLSFDVHYEQNTGLRVGGGVGPFLKLRGAKSHLEVPVNVTVGYTIQRSSNTAPYVKVGVVRHFVSGDYYVSSSPGLLAGVGVEFKRSTSPRYAIEASIDRSQIELQVVCGPASSGCTSGTEKVRSYDAVVSLFVKF
jgi:hypothetical protein